MIHYDYDSFIKCLSSQIVKIHRLFNEYIYYLFNNYLEF